VGLKQCGQFSGHQYPSHLPSCPFCAGPASTQHTGLRPPSSSGTRGFVPTRPPPSAAPTLPAPAVPIPQPRAGGHPVQPRVSGSTSRRNRQRLAAAGVGLGAALAVLVAVFLSQTEAPPGTSGTSTNVACSVEDASVEATKTAPDGVDASGRDVTYSPSNLIDSNDSTAWRTPGRGVGQTITLTFESSCELRSIQIVDGYNKIDPGDGTDRWRQNRRVVRLRIQTNRQDVTVSLDSGSRTWQTVTLSESKVDSISLTILSSAPAKTERDYTALSEIRVT